MLNRDKYLRLIPSEAVIGTNNLSSYVVLCRVTLW